MVLSVFYDLDGTIVGNVTPQVVEWHLVQKYQPSRMAAFKAQLVDVLRHHLVRPGFVEFHRSLAAALPHVEFFIYTASEHAWASVLVPCIEKALDVRFNRPLFTRNHIVREGAGPDMRKSLVRVAPLAHRALQKKGYQVTVADVVRDAVLIDNNDVLISAEAARTLRCPTYDYVLYQDMLRHLPLSVVLENLHAIQEDLADTGVFPHARKEMTEETFLTHYYTALGAAQASAARINRESRRDMYWPMLLGALLKRVARDSGFRDAGIAAVNDKVRTAMAKLAAAHKRAKKADA